MKPSPDRPVLLDSSLLHRVAQGDEQAFEELYGRSSPVLYALVLRILHDPDEAAEVLQDLYRDVWRKAGSYDAQRGSPMAWLVTMARSRAIDRLRSAATQTQRETDSIEDMLTGDLPDRAPDPFEIRADQEQRELVAKAMAELPAAQQEALELAFYGGLTHTQIAARLNQPVGTIKTRIKLGLDKLKAALRGPETS
jgi:RNA polymerase sigma-70 factor (ECF subfamily)